MYGYGFTVAARKCGLQTVDEFNTCVDASQVKYEDAEWLQQVADVGCGQEDANKINSSQRDGKKARLLSKWIDLAKARGLLRPYPATAPAKAAK